MEVLRNRMIEEMKLEHFSPGTQESYVYAVSRLAGHHNKSPDQLCMRRFDRFSRNAATMGCSPCFFYFSLRVVSSSLSNRTWLSIPPIRCR